MNIKLLALVSSFFLLCISASAEKSDVLYILDASGSMSDRIGGERRIDIAKKAIGHSLMQIPEGTGIGFRAFAHRSSQKDREQSCHDSELIAPISPARTGAISKALNTIEPRGYTPLAYSLRLAGDDFSGNSEANRSIILLSDGEETCGGNPAEELKNIIAKGIKVKVYVVGFDVDEQSRKQLHELADISEGKYFDAKNAQELNDALKEAAEKSVMNDKKTATVYGNEVRGGDSFETAVPLKAFDTEYRLDHDQRKKEFDFFSFQLKRGQSVTITLKTLEKGVRIEGGSVTQNDNPAGALAIHAPDRTVIGTMFQQGAYQIRVTTLSAAQTGSYYLRVGEEGWSLAHNGFTFQISSPSGGDLGTADDAGDAYAEGTPIEAKLYEKNTLGGSDKADVFKFTAVKGEQYRIKILPGDEFKSYLQVTVNDALKQKLLYASSASSGAGLATDVFTIRDSGVHFIKIEADTSTIFNYSFELEKQVSPPTPLASTAVR